MNKKQDILTIVLLRFIFNFYSFATSILKNLVPVFPLVIRLRLTNACNLKCSFCYVNKKDPVSSLSLTEWDNVLSSVSRFTLWDITGGESLLDPMLKPLLNKILKYF